MANSIKNHLAGKLEDACADDLKAKLSSENENTTEINEDELFTFAEYSSEKAERTGFSNYSYWKATLQVFLKNKVAVFLLIVMATIVLFTFIQPYLPNQLDPNVINNNPETFSKLTKHTQFIVITHRRGTMERADRLYGITMQEKGVSTLVSVNLIEGALEE